MTTFKLLEKLVQDLSPAAWDTLPRETKELVLARLEQKYAINRNKEF